MYTAACTQQHVPTQICNISMPPILSVVLTAKFKTLNAAVKMSNFNHVHYIFSAAATVQCKIATKYTL